MSDESDKDTGDRKPTRRRGVTAIALFVLVAGMVGLSFAAVPLYSIFCSVTGYNGTTQRAQQGSDVVLDQTVTVRFDTTIARDLPWTVKPKQNTLTLKIGETGQMIFVEGSGSVPADIRISVSCSPAPGLCRQVNPRCQ